MFWNGFKVAIGFYCGVAFIRLVAEGMNSLCSKVENATQEKTTATTDTTEA